jgi:hypothetical protein
MIGKPEALQGKGYHEYARIYCRALRLGNEPKHLLYCIDGMPYVNLQAGCSNLQAFTPLNCTGGNKMNSINMPGFTAEASLYKTNQYYPVATTGAASTTQVVPQFPSGLCTKAWYYCNLGYEKWCDIFDRNCPVP